MSFPIICKICAVYIPARSILAIVITSSLRLIAMHSFPSRYSALLWCLVSLGASQNCTLQFDARIPSEFVVAAFDSANDLFASGNVLGQGKRANPLSAVCHTGYSALSANKHQASLSAS